MTRHLRRHHINRSTRAMLASFLLLGSALTSAIVVATSRPAEAASTQSEVAWGENGNSQLGLLGDPFTSPTPGVVAIPSGVTPTTIAAGLSTSYAIGNDGNFYAWGVNDFGEYGDGTGASSRLPRKISLPPGVAHPKAIVAQNAAAFAIGGDGNLYAWGHNFYGQLGDGTTADSRVPKKLVLGSGVTPTAIAAGDENAYAIGSDGNAYAWGNNYYGQLGNGTTDSTNSIPNTPVVVSLPTSALPARAIAAFSDAAFAIGHDGNVYAWGLNQGQYGSGTGNQSTVPVVVPLPPTALPAKAIAGGGFTGYAIGNDNNLYAWGSGANGEIGNGIAN
jgi:alpha-tubulin suppressor-like RCC1 family protein